MAPRRKARVEDGMKSTSGVGQGSKNIQVDVVIVGAGLAGLTMALALSKTKTVALLAKGSLVEGASSWAQGGIAAVLDSELDSVEQHVADTLVAGAGLCDEQAARFVIERSRDAILWLIEMGVPFTKDPQAELGFHLTREGGHGQRRIIHAADATGKAVVDTLEAAARERAREGRLLILERHCAVDVILGAPDAFGSRSALGVYAQDLESGDVRSIVGASTVLATGGAGKIYQHSSNPDTSTGDGIAIGWRAGATVSNLEFMQFHPTCLYRADGKGFLITEAVRGEGGHLKLPAEAGAEAGERFMARYDERMELAPRDIVARSIDSEMKRLGLTHVDLDISFKGAAFVQEHFPNIHARCMALGLDMSKGPLPVVPASHYTCGGLLTDLHGKTNVQGLYAVGEATCTGLHGANRLASNSLLECVVLGQSAAADILASGSQAPSVLVADWDESRVGDPDERVLLAHDKDELLRLMWNYVGIVRSDKRLRAAQARIALIQHEVEGYYGQFKVGRDMLELRNLVQCAALLVECALSRRESRGLHWSMDCPQTDEVAVASLVPGRRRD
jgi:L-aspartate oxidase